MLQSSFENKFVYGESYDIIFDNNFLSVLIRVMKRYPWADIMHFRCRSMLTMCINSFIDSNPSSEGITRFGVEMKKIFVIFREIAEKERF